MICSLNPGEAQDSEMPGAMKTRSEKKVGKKRNWRFPDERQRNVQRVPARGSNTLRQNTGMSRSSEQRIQVEYVGQLLLELMSRASTSCIRIE